MNNEFTHYSVMLNECIDGLNIKPDGTYVDGTAGGGGHSLEIIKRLSEKGHLIAIDQDSDALKAAERRLSGYKDKLELHKSNFENIKGILDGRLIDGMLLDLGVSSYQIDTTERGFSYMKDAPLDMRMNKDAQLTAYDVVNNYDSKELTRVLYNWGEEKFASRIANFIIKAREAKPIETTHELAQIVKDAIPLKTRIGEPHPEKRTFQAVRIEVNRELDVIEPAIRDAAEALRPGGRIVVITFHSLEDRIIKQTFQALSQGCTCPPDFPVCICGQKQKGRIITKKPILPTEKELSENSRSKSAKLRIFEKL